MANVDYGYLKTKNGKQLMATAPYPVGAIYLSVNSTNPSELFGGTWELISQGRTLVGVDTNDTDFNISKKSGGQKHHAHGSGNLGAAIEITWTNQNVIKIGTIQNRSMGTNITMQGLPGYVNENSSTWSACRVEGQTSSSSNMPPYFTCYIWCRTA